ncbi:MAG TPA: hypothetical protein VGA77_12790, partial [Propylenella sp.]
SLWESPSQTRSKKAIKQIEFKRKGDLVTSFIRLFAGGKHILPVIEIIVGPGSEQKRRADALMDFVRLSGLRAKVSRSDIPFV